MTTLRNIHAASAAVLLIGMAATVGTALGFEHLGGYLPCKLCLEQRIPYYVGIPVMAVALITALSGQAVALTRVLLGVGGLLMCWGLVMAVYHSGVEWHFWPGPSDCGAVDRTPDAGGAGVLDQLDTVLPPSCDEAAGRFLGLSFAGWNVVASLLWGAIAFRAAFAAPRA